VPEAVPETCLLCDWHVGGERAWGVAHAMDESHPRGPHRPTVDEYWPDMALSEADVDEVCGRSSDTSTRSSGSVRWCV